MKSYCKTTYFHGLHDNSQKNDKIIQLYAEKFKDSNHTQNASLDTK